MPARTFAHATSRLRWVYANYFIPEASTRENETRVITDTMVLYKIGHHRTRWPLPGHMLVSPEDGSERGSHLHPRRGVVANDRSANSGHLLLALTAIRFARHVGYQLRQRAR